MAIFRIVDGNTWIYIPPEGIAEMQFRTCYDHGDLKLEYVPATWELLNGVPGVTLTEDGKLIVSWDAQVEREHPVTVRATHGSDVAELTVFVRRPPSKEEIIAWQATLVDRTTADKINRVMHPVALIEEQIGIIREQLVQVLNALGVKPTPEFAKLNEIAIQAIEEGRKDKEAINAQDYQIA